MSDLYPPEIPRDEQDRAVPPTLFDQQVAAVQQVAKRIAATLDDMLDPHPTRDDVAAALEVISDAPWLADMLECVGIHAATLVDEGLIGDLTNWKPIGILQALDDGTADV